MNYGGHFDGPFALPAGFEVCAEVGASGGEDEFVEGDGGTLVRFGVVETEGYVCC